MTCLILDNPFKKKKILGNQNLGIWLQNLLSAVYHYLLSLEFKIWQHGYIFFFFFLFLWKWINWKRDFSTYYFGIFHRLWNKKVLSKSSNNISVKICQAHFGLGVDQRLTAKQFGRIEFLHQINQFLLLYDFILKD